MITQRITEMEKAMVIRKSKPRSNHFGYDYHTSALGKFKNLARWEKTARAMAYAIVNQDVFALENDRVGGRIFQNCNKTAIPVPQFAPDLDDKSEGDLAFAKEYPEAEELQKYQLIGGCGLGHVTWHFEHILQFGIKGLKEKVRAALEHAKDKEAEEFYKGSLIIFDAVLEFNNKFVEEYEKLGNFELAERMRKVPEYPAEDFREAVQSFYMQHIAVTSENAYGGNSPGRLDYYLWPYLEKDIKEGRCTLEEAKEIIDEMFLLCDERLHPNDRWTEAIVVGGTKTDGTSAVNPLTYIIAQSVIDLNITHPSVYIRLPENPPEELISFCSQYMMTGNNRAQMLYDPAIIDAMVKNGFEKEDAINYACGGCMEVGPQGACCDSLYIGMQNTPKMLELMITGGVCLRTGEKVSAFKADKGLAAYDNFESFYADFIAEAERITHIFLKRQDIYNKYAASRRPSYMLSCLVDDCIERGRNMHEGGARYHDYGGTHLALADVADSVFAIKKAVFDDKICTASELVSALKADFKGYEALQVKLQKLPKYGMDNDEADEMAARIMKDFSDMYLSYKTAYGGKGMPTILTFTFAPQASAILGAAASGKNAGKLISHGVTPATLSMTEGITAAINSTCKMPFDKFAGGASTMWDFDSNWASKELISAILKTFIAKGGQIFQGNTSSVEELIAAVENPDEHKNLIVRVGGYSARFVTLEPELQQEVISRMRHGK